MTEPITDQQLADAIRERCEAPTGVHGDLTIETCDTLATILDHNPAPITPEAGKLYRFLDGTERYAIGPDRGENDWWWFELSIMAGGAMQFRVCDIAAEVTHSEVTE